MTKIISPLNPEEVKDTLGKNLSSAQPITERPTPPVNTTASPTLSGTNDSYHLNKKHYKVINLAILFFVLIVLGSLLWHFWVTPNKKSGKTIIGTVDKTTLAGINKDNIKTLPSGLTYADPDKPINIPLARQQYSIENGGYKYTFDFLKDSKVNKYPDIGLQDILTPAGSFTITVLIKPADKQKKLVCEEKGLDNFSNSTIKIVHVFGQDYPLCGIINEENKIAGSYRLSFYYLNTWHQLFLGHINHGGFTEQLAVDVLNSLKIEKL